MTRNRSDEDEDIGAIMVGFVLAMVLALGWAAWR